MVLSMTGYGRAQGYYREKSIIVELRALNGKTTDIRCKIPLCYKEKELELRKLITDNALRGKFDFTISNNSNGTETDSGIDEDLFVHFYNQLKEIEKKTGMSETDYTQAILRIPNVVKAIEGELSDEEYNVVKSITLKAVDQLTAFRKAEGAATKKDLKESIAAIIQCLHKIQNHEEPRLEKLKTRLSKSIQEYISDNNLDRNRLEQEMFYYIEKLDINEEKSRLEQHCQYFIEELEKPEALKGRTLSFIGQEIGREINTMGAKAQYSEIQKLVVGMKNELEKIKEQLANIV